MTKEEWYLNGKLHRSDGPAIICANGHQEWYLNGKLHRSDGPAIICANGHQEWRVNGLKHRLDGPAVANADGFESWWVNGVKIPITEIDFWISQCSINPNWTDWNDDEKLLFRMRF